MCMKDLLNWLNRFLHKLPEPCIGEFGLCKDTFVEFTYFIHESGLEEEHCDG